MAGLASKSQSRALDKAVRSPVGDFDLSALEPRSRYAPVARFENIAKPWSRGRTQNGPEDRGEVIGAKGGRV